MELHSFLQQNPLVLGKMHSVTNTQTPQNPGHYWQWFSSRNFKPVNHRFMFFNVHAANISKHFKLVTIKHKIHGLKRRNKQKFKRKEQLLISITNRTWSDKVKACWIHLTKCWTDEAKHWKLWNEKKTVTSEQHFLLWFLPKHDCPSIVCETAQ